MTQTEWITIHPKDVVEWLMKTMFRSKRDKGWEIVDILMDKNDNFVFKFHLNPDPEEHYGC
jgi:hypothetical protein